MARQITQAVLTRSGHVVACVNDGHEAWVALTARPDGYDVLITDHDMPRLNGLALVTQLRANGFGGHIVVVSGSIDAVLAAKYRALEVDAMLAKPFSVGELIDTVRMCRTD